jgi:hypothetical protein
VQVKGCDLHRRRCVALMMSSCAAFLLLLPGTAMGECPDEATVCMRTLTTAPSGSRLSFFVLSEIGVGGEFSNPAPSTVAGLELAPALGALRWHLSVAFENLNRSNGARVDLLSWGVPFEVYTFGGKAHLEVEPILGFPIEAVSGAELYSDVEARVAVNFVMNRFYATATVVGIEARWLAVTGYSTVGFGSDWPLRAGVGVQF